MYLQFYDVDKLSFEQICDAYTDIGKKLNGNFKITVKLNEKISVEIIQNPFDSDNKKPMNTILSAVFAKIASLNLGYGRALVKENEDKVIIEVYLKKE